MPINPLDLLYQNPWWKNPDAILDDPKVKEATTKKPAKTYTYSKLQNTVLLGPRQVGKTTYLKLLVKHLLEKGVDSRCILYFSCETLDKAGDIIDLLVTYQNMFSLDCHRYILLDEVTFVEDWEKAIKHILDTPLSTNNTIYITGSSSIWLYKGAEKMPGRNIGLKIFMPQSFREYTLLFGSTPLKNMLENIETINIAEKIDLEQVYRQAVQLTPHLDEITRLFRNYISTGGFLKPSYNLLEKGVIPEDTYITYIKWIEGDIAKLGKNVNILRKILDSIAEKISTRVSYATIARETGLGSHVTVRDYVETLEGLLVVRTYYQVGPDRKSPSYRKDKKIYFTDPFLYSVAKGYSHEVYRDYSLENEDRIVETIIAEHLSRQFRQHHPRVMFYVEDKETDFAVLKNNRKLVGIEVKWKNNVDKKDFPNRHRFREKILVSKKDLQYIKRENILIIPAPLLLLQLKTHPIYSLTPQR